MKLKRPSSVSFCHRKAVDKEGAYETNFGIFYIYSVFSVSVRLHLHHILSAFLCVFLLKVFKSGSILKGC